MPEETATLEAPQSTQEPSRPSARGHSAELSRSPQVEGGLGESSHEANSEGNQPPQPKNGEQQQTKKQPSRYERTKRERAAFKAEREQFLREREAFTREREEAAKPKRDYTLKDLTDARAAWENEGRFDLVEAADKEIKKIQAEEQARAAASNRTVQMPVRGTPEHTAMWNESERDLAQRDPEFMRAGTRLDTKLREIMAGPHGDMYRDHAQGIYAAYDAAKRQLLEEDNQNLQTELAKSQEELRRYRGLTSIGGGVPAKLGSGAVVENVKDFARLSTKDQRKHLLSGANRSGVPWF